MRTRNFFSKIPKTQTKRRFLALVKHYIINLEFLNAPSFPQGPELIVILCILPLFTFKPLRVLAASNVLRIVRNTRQAKHDSTTTGQAKLVGIEPSLWKTFNLCTRLQYIKRFVNWYLVKGDSQLSKHENL